MRIYPVLFLIATALPFSQACAADEPLTPSQRVERGVGRIIEILRDKSLDLGARQREIEKIVDRGFDFRSMSQSILATHWKRATPLERDRFVLFFSQYLENTYMKALNNYTDEHIRYTDERIRGDRAVVDTKIVTNTGTEIPVNYKLKLNDGKWYAYDVVIEGVSLVSNYRNSFAQIIRSEGMEGLLSDLQRRIDQYKNTRDNDAGQSSTQSAGK